MVRLILMFFCLCVAGCAGRHSASISGTVADHMDANGHWCYWYVDYDGQSDILDSCLIAGNRFAMSARLPGTEVLSEILISGPKGDYYFVSTSREHAKIHIDSTTRLFMPNMEGSETTKKMRRQLDELGYLQHDKIAAMQDSLLFAPAGSEASRLWEDSIAYYTDERAGLCRDIILNSGSAICATAVFTTELPKYIGADSLEKVRNYIMAEFPNSGYLFLIDRNYLPAFSRRTVWAANRRARILGKNLPFPDWKYGKTTIFSDDDGIEAYKVGDIVSELIIPDAGNNGFDLKRVRSDYILIDFWASWCRPCRLEIPSLKSAYREHGEILRVVAVSIDRERDKWVQAIKEDGTMDFTHILLNEENANYGRIMKRFDVRAIPRNFLLDKNRRIIAVDLYGDALERKLSGLN